MKTVLSAIKKLRIRNTRNKIFWLGISIATSGLVMMLASVMLELLLGKPFFSNDNFLKLGMLFGLTGLPIGFELLKKKAVYTNRP